MKFFFDRNCPRPLVQMMAVYAAHYGQHYLVHHNDSGHGFGPNTKDVEWIAELSKEDPPYYVVSGDNRIVRNEAELEALREANLHFFMLAPGWTSRPPHSAAVQFLKVWPIIEEHASQARMPQIWEVPTTSLQLVLLGPTKNYVKRKR